jgi:hypothetical protein
VLPSRTVLLVSLRAIALSVLPVTVITTVSVAVAVTRTVEECLGLQRERERRTWHLIRARENLEYLIVCYLRLPLQKQ